MGFEMRNPFPFDAHCSEPTPPTFKFSTKGREFRVEVLRVQGFRVQVSGIMVHGSGFSVQRFEFRVLGLGFRFQVLVFSV